VRSHDRGAEDCGKPRREGQVRAGEGRADAGTALRLLPEDRRRLLGRRREGETPLPEPVSHPGPRYFLVGGRGIIASLRTASKTGCGLFVVLATPPRSFSPSLKTYTQLHSKQITRSTDFFSYVARIPWRGMKHLAPPFVFSAMPFCN